ncbi:hypothetical protein [Neptuniibacter sp. 2_MG-2023]|uniref:hypothetical protein n=1 Tax=Neptuniibacter sp. 2_MG-2023 TaxID=3062671 RepID=UPI0026E2A7CF|nr:hypothetical protein [Neptuniibacter sp. 2_MG-2023]MDO6515285.1 hypothetical protein [Neptuniibacter sp. 2_MG-2023]
MSNDYFIKDEEKLLIAILDKYVEDNGEQFAALDAYQISSLDPLLFENVPRITKEKVHNRQNSDGRYFENLKLKKFISGEGIASPYHFYLTPLGFQEGQRLKSPKAHFCKHYWKFLLGSTFSFLAALAAIGKYIQC